MKISIIGAGNVGSVLATNFVNLKHEVFIANSRGPESLAQFADETGATPVTLQEVVKNGEVIIIAIPQNNITKLPDDLLKDVHENVVIIETVNYFPTITGNFIPELEEGLIESEWVQKQIGRTVNKVFNSISVQSLKDAGKPKGDKNRIALPVSGDDTESKAIVMQLIEELGFDPFDNGKICDSWKQQPGSSVFCTDLNLESLTSSLKEMGEIYTPEINNRNSTARDTAMQLYLDGLKG